MSIEISITDGPLPDAPPWRPGGAGGVISFEGVVRVMEDGRALRALHYEAYEPMAGNELRRLAEQVMQEHKLIALKVEHSRGEVAVGACSFRLRIAAAHRKPALAAMDAFIDRLKRDVPIWKSPVWQDAEVRS